MVCEDGAVLKLFARSLLISLILKAARTCEAFVKFYETTRSNISEDSHLYTRSRENLTYQTIKTFSKPTGIRMLCRRLPLQLDAWRLSSVGYNEFISVPASHKYNSLHGNLCTPSTL